LYENERAYAMLSLGPIVPGYVLVISKFHIPCSAALSGMDAHEFDRLVANTRRILRMTYGHVALYEHGQLGSCMHEDAPIPQTHCYHAHMHCVPTSVNVGRLVEEDFPPTIVNSWEELRTIYRATGTPYLFTETDCKRVFFIEKKIRSQYLRHKLASALCDATLADWVAVPGWESIRKAKHDLRLPFAELARAS